MTPEIKHRIEQIKNGEIPKGYKHSKVGIIPEDWKVLRLKDKFDRLSRKNAEGNTNVLTISAQYGLINQEEFFKKEIASDDKSNYYLLHRGEFAYNKSYSNGYPFGAIKRLSRYDKGVVSPLYICFSANPNNACPEYYEQYFEAGRLNHEIQAYAQEGARNHGLLNISVIDFFNSKIIVPPIAEQKRIAKILSAQDTVIECYEKKIEQLKRMKKYYLQNMFPKRGETVPKIRFKGFTESWEQRKIGQISTFINGRAYSKSELLPNGKYKVLRVGNFYTNDSWYYSDLELGEKYYANFGDLLYTWSTTFGPHLWLGDKVIYHYHIWKVDLSDQLEKHFAIQLLEQDKNNIMSGKNGSTMVHITKEGMEQKEVIIPPDISEQAKIGTFFGRIDNLITLHQRKLEEEKKKKKALQQLLLTGIVRTN